MLVQGVDDEDTERLTSGEVTRVDMYKLMIARMQTGDELMKWAFICLTLNHGQCPHCVQEEILSRGGPN